MKKIYYTFSLFVGFFFSTAFVFAQLFPVETIVYNGSPDKMVNLVIMGDGYTAAQQDKFMQDVRKNIEGMFGQEPWKSKAQFINVYAIKVVSNVSGAADRPSQPIDNYFGSSFNTSGIERLLYPTRINRVVSVLSNNLPFYDIGVIVVNDGRYGGAGGSFATFSTHPSALEIMIHELGHTFTRLSDEYWAGDQFARETPNMSRDNNPATNRWRTFLNNGGVGIFPHEESPAWFRPHNNCKMRFLGRDFCPVCMDQLTTKIDDLTKPAALQSPQAFFGADKLEILEGQEVRFFDLTSQSPDTWSWIFQGGSPETTSTQNPTVSFENEGNYQVTLTTSNSVGTSTFQRNQFIIVKKDTEAPILSTRNPIIQLNQNGQATLSVAQVDTGTSDNVGIQSMTLSQTAFDCSHVGVNNITFTVVDVNGNEASTTVSVTVVDNIAPVVRTKAFTLVLNEEGVGELKPEDIDDGSFDNCGIESLSLSKTTFGREDSGDNTVTLTVRDIHGNSGSATATVRVDIILFANQEIQEAILLYPNPSQGYLQLTFPQVVDPTLKSIEILDTKGSEIRRITEFPSTGKVIPIDVSHLPNGLYLLQLTSEKYFQTIRFVIQK
ncbi:M64 family metallopeptidase [Mongoliitalea daihaiensis]|uniref:M64 family metallopeptidase n=1 Tax=Mongoliitalea daihaiensis TaxID=2782006 RepID=UPI001F15CCDD|nr:M64 family metallopeptidase [Mongoliitalea daihaiensis]UJP64788.1 T9SS type A sorting domain-containing protein [Mongoliitalea daihaiensis]